MVVMTVLTLRSRCLTYMSTGGCSRQSVSAPRVVTTGSVRGFRRRIAPMPGRFARSPGSAHPIALRRKKSLSPMADSIAVVSSSTSAGSRVPSWQMIDARRSHRSSLRVHVSKCRADLGRPAEQQVTDPVC